MPHKIFSNPWPHETHGVLDILKWKFGLGPQERPEIADASNEPPDLVPVTKAELHNIPRSGWRILWLGHASFLIQGMGLSILIDPIFAEHCAPFRMKSLIRKVDTPCALEDLPKIDFVLLTHSHYDHLDLATLRKLGNTPQFIIAEGHAKWLGEKLGLDVSELAWHQRKTIAPGLTLTATPAQHFTARTPFDRNHGHWCGWLLEGDGHKIWHTGDSAYCPAFRDIGDRYGPIDFAMIPIGAYQPRNIMKAMHMNPEEAVQVFQDAKCKRAVGMHWGTFELTDEPLQEPPLRLKRELILRKLPPNSFSTGPVGSMWKIDGDST